MVSTQKIESHGLPIAEVLDGLVLRGWRIDAGARAVIAHGTESPEPPGVLELAIVDGSQLPPRKAGNRRGSGLQAFAQSMGLARPTLYGCLLFPFHVPPEALVNLSMNLLGGHTAVHLPRRTDPNQTHSYVIAMRIYSFGGLVSAERVGEARSVSRRFGHLFQVSTASAAA